MSQRMPRAERVKLPWKEALRQAAEDVCGVFLILSIWAFFDAMVGGAISFWLKAGGWGYAAQQVNDSWQFGFGLLTIVLTAAVFWGFGREFGYAFVAMLMGFMEDAMYYIFLPIAKCITAPLLKTTCDLDWEIPKLISGWYGWVARNVFDYTIPVGIERDHLAILFNVVLVAVFIHFVIVERSGKRFQAQTKR